MKRLGVFVSILMLTIGLFGGFLGAEKATAQVTDCNTITNETQREACLNANQVTKADFNAIVQKILNVLKKIPNVDPQLDVWKNFPKQNLQYAADTVFNQKNYSTTATKSEIEVLILQKYAAFLTEEQQEETSKILPFRDDNYVRKIAAYQNEVSLLLTQAQIAVRKESGAITENQALTANSEALASAEKTGAIVQNSIIAAKESCSFSVAGETNVGACISQGFTWFVKTILLNLAAYLFSLAANMLNLAVQIGIFDFAKWASSSLYPLWIIVRQIISLIIVFVGLYLGFLYILGNDTKFGRYLPWVVAFGLFVNFSYPLSRTAIDISNIVSLNLYTNSVGGDVFLPDTSTIKDRKTPGTIMLGKLGIQNLVNDTLKVPTAKTSNDSLNTPYGAVVAVAVVGYAAYIFFVATFIMVIRTLTLIFITVLSPLLLVDAVLPVLGNKAKELRGLFLNQLIVGPIFMLMLALTFKFLDIFSLSTGTGSFDALASGGSGTADSVKTVFSLLMMLGMLHITLKVTRSFSGEVGKVGSEMLGTVGGFGLGVASGGMGLIGRKTIGAGALKLKESEWVQKNQHTPWGRMVHGASNSLANSTFNLNNSSVVAGGVKKLGMGISSGMGSASVGPKVGFEAAADERAKKIAERSQKIKVKHTSDVYETDANGNKVLKHRAGTVDEAATRAARERFNNVRGGAIFQTKEEKEKIDDLLKNNKDAIDRKILSEYKEFDDTPEGQQKKRLFFENQSPEIRAKLKKYDDDQLAEKTKKELKEQEDKAYRNDTLQTQKDLVQAQKDLADALKNNQQTSPNTTTPTATTQTQGQGASSSGGVGATTAAAAAQSQGSGGSSVPSLNTVTQTGSTQTQGQGTATPSSGVSTTVTPGTTSPSPTQTASGRPLQQPGESPSAYAARLARYRKNQQNQVAATV